MEACVNCGSNNTKILNETFGRWLCLTCGHNWYHISSYTMCTGSSNLNIKPSAETIFFKIEKTDTHNAYDEKTKKYAIVHDGLYTVKKYYKAGDVIDDPISVERK